MSARRCLPVLCLVLTLGSFALAQESTFYWDPVIYDEFGNVTHQGQGGMVDSQTGLVWSVCPYWGYHFDFDFAQTQAVELYIASEWGFGYADWRIPTISEWVDAANRGLISAYEPLIGVVPTPYGYWAEDGTWTWRNVAYWSSTQKTSNRAYAYIVGEGPILTAKYSALTALYVRGQSVPPPKPPKH